MFRKKYIILIYLAAFFYLLGSSNFCYAEGISPTTLNPAVLGKESINILQENEYSQADTALNILHGQLKFERELKNSDFSLSAIKEGPDKSFSLNKIVLKGNTKLGSQRFKKLFKQYEEKEITITDLKEICDKITRYYHSKGYITSQAKLLAQKVDDGIVEITVEEGKYSEISIRGNKWAKEQYLNNILNTYNIKEGGVLNVYDLQTAMEEIKNKKYITGNIIIERTPDNSLNNIVLDVKDRLPLNLDANFNNLGTDLTGMERTFVKATYENVTGRGDSLSLGAILGKGNLGGLVGYSIPINKKGTTLNLGYSAFNTKYGGISARKIDKRGFWSSSFVTSTGLPFLGATQLEQGADGQFLKFNLGLNRLQVMPKRSMLLLSVNGQFTSDELMTPEKAALGGMNMRGYETASILGDKGVYGTIEYRTPVPGLRKICPEKLKKYEEGIKLGFFYDYGITSNVNGIKNVANSKDTNFLQSVGMGIHIPVGKLLMANFDFGIPIGNPGLVNQGARFTFSLTSSLQDMWKWKEPDIDKVVEVKRTDKKRIQ
ncbi:MAG: POTRA domain-containing protein [Candidatus Gastranaerophilales bacterium]|nr:POTRA domain-containing protein [Candidatus Gastranaerophilales bacterium]